MLLRRYRSERRSGRTRGFLVSPDEHCLALDLAHGYAIPRCTGYLENDQNTDDVYARFSFVHVVEIK